MQDDCYFESRSSNLCLYKILNDICITYIYDTGWAQITTQKKTSFQ